MPAGQTDRRRVILISPKGPLYRKRGGIFGRSLRYMPLTFPTLAALVPRELPIDLICLDEAIEEVDPATLQADLVGMTVITGNAMRAYELSRVLRSRGIPVILGGPHITLAPDDARPHADAIVVGYAEQTWPQLLRDFAAGDLQPRYDQPPGFDLADSPPPDRSVLPRRQYVTDDVYEATRGCVHNCDFCVVPHAWGRKPFQKPVDHIVEDIRRKGSRRVVFVDLNLIADEYYAARLFEALIPLRVEWYGLSTTLLCEPRNRELLDLCARSGCRGLLMGFESIGAGSLRLANKGFNDPAKYRDVVRRLHDHRIALQACFVFGMDDDDGGVFDRTAAFTVDAGIDLPRFAIATPFPGTALYQRLEAEGRILSRDWSQYDGQHVVFQPARMTIDQLQRGTARAWQAAYSLRGIWRRLRRTAAPWHVALVTNYGYRHYANHLDRFYTCDAMTAVGWRAARAAATAQRSAS